MISIIVPTYNEAEVLPNLIERISEALGPDMDSEILIVDDNSLDGTGSLAKKLSEKYPIRTIIRPRKMGLASAVMNGFDESDGEILTVLDADLQHPPEKISSLIEAIKENADIAIGSRYVSDGETKNWSLKRKIISKTANYLSRLLIPQTRKIKDPISGFFALRKRVIENSNLQPKSSKILLEILTKGKYEKVVEVPYQFSPRQFGKSKFELKTIINFIHHLLTLSKTNK